MISNDMDEKLVMLKYFILESRELLDDVEPQIISENHSKRNRRQGRG